MYQNLLELKSDELLAPSAAGGIIVKLIESSASYCLRLSVAEDEAPNRRGLGAQTKFGVPTPTVSHPHEEQTPTMARPEICFEKWDLTPDPGVGIASGQAGFYLANDGIAAHEVLIESFKIGGGVVNGAMISRIEANGKNSMLVWIEGYPPGSPEKWDLLGAMAAESNQLGRGDIHSAPYSVEIVATYRDSLNNKYRSRSKLSYSAGQRTLTFGDTRIERISTCRHCSAPGDGRHDGGSNRSNGPLSARPTGAGN